MATKSTVIAIINPNSGTTSAEQKKVLLDAFMRRAEALDYSPEVRLTTHAGHATELAADAVKRGVSRLIAIGGDGTINETAQALRRTSTSLGIVPIGSGNGLARHLGVPLNPLKSIERALSGRPVVIDSGEINEYPFFCTAGMGFEAYVAHEFAKAPVRGLPTYMRTAFRAFWAYKPARYMIDGQEKTLFSMTFANAGQFGNNAWMAPTANIADGKLEQCEIRPFPAQAAGMLTWRLFNKTLHHSAYWRGHSITKAVVETDEPLLIHVDGEPLTLPTGRVEVRVFPGSLLVVL
ncbi:diacylglycerol/lipid kinase family protein [Spirosoma gilvum]